MLLWHWEWNFHLEPRSRKKDEYRISFSSKYIWNWIKLNILSTKDCYDLEIERMTFGQGQCDRTYCKEYLYPVCTLKVKQSLFYRLKFVVTLRMKIWHWVKVKVKELGLTIIWMKFELWRSNTFCSLVK